MKVDDNIVTLLSDLSMKEIRVLSSDIQECTEVTSGRLELGSYELHDLVQIGSSVGIIVKIERDSFRILDTGGHVQTIALQEMGVKRNNKVWNCFFLIISCCFWTKFAKQSFLG